MDLMMGLEPGGIRRFWEDGGRGAVDLFGKLDAGMSDERGASMTFGAIVFSSSFPDLFKFVLRDGGEIGRRLLVR